MSSIPRSLADLQAQFEADTVWGNSKTACPLDIVLTQGAGWASEELSAKPRADGVNRFEELSCYRLSMSHPVDTAKAIGWALYHASKHGRTPVGIVVDRATGEWMRNHDVGDWWGHYPTLFNLPVEVNAHAEGWAVQTR